MYHFLRFAFVLFSEVGQNPFRQSCNVVFHTTGGYTEHKHFVVHRECKLIFSHAVKTAHNCEQNNTIVMYYAFTQLNIDLHVTTLFK